MGAAFGRLRAAPRAAVAVTLALAAAALLAAARACSNRLADGSSKRELHEPEPEEGSEVRDRKLA